MSQHFTFADTSQPGTIPFNATFPFPSQVNKANKLIAKIPPKNGMAFVPGSFITIVIPAQGYTDTLKTTIVFDFTLFPQVGGTATDGSSTAIQGTNGITRLQNSAASWIQRLRWTYGSNTGEDVQDYDLINRMLVETTATNQQGILDNQSICEGVGGYTLDIDSAGITGHCNTRQKWIQGSSQIGGVTPAIFSGSAGFGNVPGGSDTPGGVFGPTVAQSNAAITRRYQLALLLGIFTQGKLLPSKWMASSFTLEFTCAPAARCLYTPVLATAATPGTGGVVLTTPITTPTYGIGNFFLIQEVLEFDDSYDEAFYEGLADGGCPIHYSSFNVTHFTNQGNQAQIAVPEKGRSVKAVFAMQTRPIPDFTKDFGTFHMDTAAHGTSTLQSYQWRIANKWYPAQPVLTSAIGSAKCNGAAEAYVELQKALNCLNDYRLSPNVSVKNWGLQGADGILHEFDYKYSVSSFNANNVPQLTSVEQVGTGANGNAFCGTLPSQCFIMSVSLETSNGIEISGLNSEEQSDIYLSAQWTSPQVLGVTSGPVGYPQINIVTYTDRVLVLKPNNVGVIIQ